MSTVGQAILDGTCQSASIVRLHRFSVSMKAVLRHDAMGRVTGELHQSIPFLYDAM